MTNLTGIRGLPARHLNVLWTGSAIPAAQLRGTGSKGPETHDVEEGDRLAQVQAYGVLVFNIFHDAFFSFSPCSQRGFVFNNL